MIAQVLVTGAAGFIGSHLVDALLARGVRVVGLDRRRLGEAVAGCDTVFYLAARPGVRRSWGREFLDYTQADVLGTHRLLDACTRQGRTPAGRRLVVERLRAG